MSKKSKIIIGVIGGLFVLGLLMTLASSSVEEDSASESKPATAETQQEEAQTEPTSEPDPDPATPPPPEPEPEPEVAFNLDGRQQPIAPFEIGFLDDDRYFVSSKPDTCRYSLQAGPSLSRSDIELIGDLEEYRGPIILSSFNDHILTDNCGDWREVDSPL